LQGLGAPILSALSVERVGNDRTLLGLSNGLRLAAIGAMTASRAAAGTALEMVGRGEDEVWPFVVVIFGFERRQVSLRVGWKTRVHASIFS
jgi:hypothetical protein